MLKKKTAAQKRRTLTTWEEAMKSGAKPGELEMPGRPKKEGAARAKLFASIDPDLYEKLAADANANMRSVSAQVAFILSQYYNSDRSCMLMR